MSDKAALVIGASRGIGLGLARELAARDYRVFASRRGPSEELARAVRESGGRILEVVADVTDEASIEAITKDLSTASLDLLVLNAGIYGKGDQSIPALDRDRVADILMTNAVGPAQSAVTLLPLVKEGGTIGMITSRMGSISDSSGGANLYRISKTAQNMLARSLFENHARGRGIAVLSLHPGWVKTDMGGPNAMISVEESVTGLCDQLEGQDAPEHRFLDYSGEAIGW